MGMDSDHSRNFFDELKRRNVFRIGAAYAVVAWLLIQVIDTLAPRMAMPDWVPGFVIILLLVGFPVALIFAWAFELTPEGLRKSKSVEKVASVAASTGRKLDFAIIGLMALALGYFIWESRFSGGAGTGIMAEAQAADTSIAVLPFADMSPEGDQTYFTDGISEEILNVLAKIPELHVTSRSSAFQFRGNDIHIPTVAQQLGVAHVLEGSVRKQGLKVRITAQLIDAANDKHLWSETYDRDLTDIFAVQDEISAAIVDALKETLGVETAAPQAIKAAADPETYNAYLLGQHLIRKRTKVDIEASIPNLEQAILLDPGYAPAHAALALAWRLLMGEGSAYGDLTLEEMLEKAVPHVEKALALDPNLPEGLGVKGLILEAQGQLEQAVELFERALQINPSLTNVRNWYASALGDLSRPIEEFEQREIAYERDPLSVLALNNYVTNLLQRQMFEAAVPVLARLEQIDPARGAMFRGNILLRQHRVADGVNEQLRAADAYPDNLRSRAWISLSLLDLNLLAEALRLWPYQDDGWGIISGSTEYATALEMARVRALDSPDNPEMIGELAWAYYNVGDYLQAEKFAKRYLEGLSPERRASHGLNWIKAIQAWRDGDREGVATLFESFEGIEARFDAAGIDGFYGRILRARWAFVQGDEEKAYEHLTHILEFGLGSSSFIDVTYRDLGWNDIPRFAEVRRQYEAYVREERLKLLAIACGGDGFETWKPLPETCAQLD